MYQGFTFFLIGYIVNAIEASGYFSPNYCGCCNRTFCNSPVTGVVNLMSSPWGHLIFCKKESGAPFYKWGMLVSLGD